MKRLFYVISYWLPAILWMYIIFYFSSKPRVAIVGTYIWDFFIFKTIHLLEYAILYFLLFRAIYSIKNRQLTINHKLLLTFIFSFFYAALDEIHQTFILTREGTIRDVAIDTTGIFIMYIYIKSHLNFVKKFLRPLFFKN